MDDTKNIKSKEVREKRTQGSNSAVFEEIKRVEESVSGLDNKLTKFVQIMADMLEEAGAGGLTKRARYGALEKLKTINEDNG